MAAVGVILLTLHQLRYVSYLCHVPVYSQLQCSLLYCVQQLYQTFSDYDIRYYILEVLKVCIHEVLIAALITIVAEYFYARSYTVHLCMET